MSVDFNEEKEFDLFLLIQQCNFEKLTELFAIHYFPDVNVLKEYHQNVIFIAARYIRYDSQCLKMISFLINHRLNPLLIDSNKQNVLFFTCAAGLIETTKYLYENFAFDKYQVDIMKETPLFYAVKYNRVDIVNYLYSKGFDINHQNAYGENCLFSLNGKKKVEMTKEEAIKFYEKENSLRGILQLDNEQKKGVSLCFCEDYYNYFYGVMPIDTSYINVFDIIPYNDGFLLRYPDKENPEALEPGLVSKKMISTLDEYKDIHRVLDVNTIYKLNKQIREGKSAELVLLAEALHEKKISDIADNVVKRKNVKVILIAGPSSSGKTTFAKRLGIQLRLNGLKPVTISVDDYFVEREQTPLDENGKYNFECIEAIDLKLFNEHLTTLLNGGEILCPTFDFKEGSKKYTGKKMRLAEDEVLVIEGIHCLNDKLTESIPKELKYKIYISALTVLNVDYYNRISTTDSRLIRRMVRDHNFRGYTAMHTLQMWNSVNKGENQYIFPFQDEADSMFNTSLIYELCVLKKYALPMLQEIDNSYVEYAEAKRLCEFLKYFEDIEDKYVPQNSLLREFIGGSIFEY